MTPDQALSVADAISTCDDPYMLECLIADLEIAFPSHAWGELITDPDTGRPWAEQFCHPGYHPSLLNQRALGSAAAATSVPTSPQPTPQSIRTRAGRVLAALGRRARPEERSGPGRAD